MLHIYIRNDGTGTDKSANYTCSVHVNKEMIGFCRLFGHRRNDGWIALVRMMLDKMERHDKAEGVK
jgi:hypothetical protein